MVLDLTEVFAGEGRTVTTEAETALRQIVTGGTTIPVKDASPVSLTFVNNGKGRALLTGRAEITLAMHCDRCLKPVDETLALVFDREVYAPDAPASAADVWADQEFMDGCRMDVDDFLHMETVINLPVKVLCRPDCRGICRMCGRDLNTGTCDCDTFVPDPRMALIKDIFYGNKEV